MRNETLRLMRRGAAHRLKFVERCGGGCRRGAGEFGAGEQVSRYGWAKGQRSTNNWRGVVLQYWSVLNASLGYVPRCYWRMELPLCSCCAAGAAGAVATREVGQIETVPCESKMEPKSTVGLLAVRQVKNSLAPRRVISKVQASVLCSWPQWP